MNDERDGRPEPELQIVEALIEEHAQFDCDIISIDDETWAIHGSISVSGEVILAEFRDKREAEAALAQLSAAENWPNRPTTGT